MSQSEDIREQIAAALAGVSAIPGLEQMQVSAFVLTNPIPPCAFVADGDIDYHASMGADGDGSDWLWFTVTMLVGFTTDLGSQTRMDILREPGGDTSVKSLIEALGDNYVVTKAHAPEAFKSGGVQNPIFGAEWTLKVLA